MKLFFSYSPPRTHPPPPPTQIAFESISSRSSGCFRVDFVSRQAIDSKTTRNRPKSDSKFDSLGGGWWWWGVSPGGGLYLHNNFTRVVR